jgi:TATA-binding protein-associated factor Taf7
VNVSQLKLRSGKLDDDDDDDDIDDDDDDDNNNNNNAKNVNMLIQISKLGRQLGRPKRRWEVNTTVPTLSEGMETQ